MGNTRGDRSIDRIFTNVDHEEAGTLPPLETDPGEDEGEGTPKKSDHDIAFCKMKLPRMESFEMLTYSYRYYNPDSEEKFGRWLASMDWSELEAAGTSNEKTEIYQMEVTRAQDRLFPLITVRRQSNDPPWYNRNIKRRIKQKKGIYRREGRSQKWRRLKRVIAVSYTHLTLPTIYSV